MQKRITRNVALKAACEAGALVALSGLALKAFTRQATDGLDTVQGDPATDYETAIGFYQILNQNPANLRNEPLQPKSPTLTRTDMITFQ